MALVTVNDVGVLSGVISMPLVGVWIADLKIDQPDGTGFDAGTAVTISGESGWSLSGTVAPDRSGDFLDAVHVRVLGGKAGMAKTAQAKAYVQPGAYARDVIKGLASSAGESVSSTADSVIMATNLTAWAVMAVPCARALETLLDVVAPAAHWRILADGTLWVGNESWTSLDGTYDLLSANPTEGFYDLGVEAPTITPGVSITSVGNVNRVEHEIAADKIRSRVWVDLSEGQRGAAAAIQAIVEHTTAKFDYFALYQATVKSQSSDWTTVDVQPAKAGVPGLSNVPLRHGLPGFSAQVSSGATVLVGWDSGNPSKPYACLWGGGETVQDCVVKASAIHLGDSSGTQPAVMGNDCTTRFSNLESALNNLMFLPSTEVTGTAGPYPIVATVGPKLIPPISNPPAIKATVVNVK